MRREQRLGHFRPDRNLDYDDEDAFVSKKKREELDSTSGNVVYLIDRIPA